MNRTFALAALACTALSSPAFAQQDTVPVADGTDGGDTIIVTAARTILPPNALPLTIDVIGKDSLDQQIAISGSVTDAVATLTPSFSPTRQKLSGCGRDAARPLAALCDQRHPAIDADARRQRATASRSTASSSTVSS